MLLRKCEMDQARSGVWDLFSMNLSALTLEICERLGL